MYYEINVSFNGSHLFATHKRSITTYDECIELYELFKDKFPKDEGFEIAITRYETIGKSIELA